MDDRAVANLDGRLGLRVRQQLIGPVVRLFHKPLYGAAWLWRRLLWRTKFIAVTGSLGKTTAKEMIAAALSVQGPTYRTIGNQNGGLLMALNVLRVRPWHRYAVIETAISRPGQMERAARLVRPDAAVVLTVRRTHTRSFPTLDVCAQEKGRLVEALAAGKAAVLNGDDRHVAAMADRTAGRAALFGRSPNFELWADEISARWPERLRFKAHSGGESVAVSTRLVGEHWLPSALAALLTARRFGVPLKAAAEAIGRVEPFRGRLQPVRVPSGAVFLRDDYASTIDAAEAAFDVLAGARASRRLLVITDISDTGTARKERLKHIVSRIRGAADGVVIIGEKAPYGVRRAIEAGIAPENAFAFSTVRKAAEFLTSYLRPDDFVLLKGRVCDHVERIFFHQIGAVACWKPRCPKTMMCEECWELGLSNGEKARASLVHVEPAAAPGAFPPER